MPTPYAVCPLAVLEEAARIGSKYRHPPKGRDVKDERSKEEKGLPAGADDGWELSYQHQITKDVVKVTVNARGRVILTVNNGREIIILRTNRGPSTLIGRGSEISGGEVLSSSSSSGGGGIASKPTCEREWSLFAFDRNCYHVGYPMDLGDVEEHIQQPVPTRGGEVSSAKKNVYQCINCPLHNRIFDLETGDMLALDSEGEACSTGGYQRVHEWKIAPLGMLKRTEGSEEIESGAEVNPDDIAVLGPDNWNSFKCRMGALPGTSTKFQQVCDPSRWKDDDLWIVVLDSHGESNPLVMTKTVKKSQQQPTTTTAANSGELGPPPSAPAPAPKKEEFVVYLPEKKIPSDVYNRRDGCQLEWIPDDAPEKKRQRTEAQP